MLRASRCLLARRAAPAEGRGWGGTSRVRVGRASDARRSNSASKRAAARLRCPSAPAAAARGSCGSRPRAPPSCSPATRRRPGACPAGPEREGEGDLRAVGRQRGQQHGCSCLLRSTAHSRASTHQRRPRLQAAAVAVSQEDAQALGAQHGEAAGVVRASGAARRLVVVGIRRRRRGFVQRKDGRQAVGGRLDGWARQQLGQHCRGGEGGE